MSILHFPEHNSPTQILESQFLGECTTLKKKGFHFLSEKKVNVRINWNKNELYCLPITPLKRGDILHDPYNDFSIKITFIAKRQLKYPSKSKNSNYIKIDLCNFKRIKG